MNNTPKKPRAKSKYMLLWINEEGVFQQIQTDFDSISEALDARDSDAEQNGGTYRIVTIRSHKTATQQTGIKWN